MITVTQGDKKLDITTNFNLTFQQLQQKIKDSFGDVKDLRGLAYKVNQNLSYILDEDAFNKAKANFPQRLDLIIHDKAAKMEEYLIGGFKELKGITSDWDQDDWISKILTNVNPKKPKIINPKKLIINYVPEQLSKAVIKEIEANTAKTERFGHSEDRVGSFLMSCYNLDAKEHALSNSGIDKSLWKLDKWRY